MKNLTAAAILLLAAQTAAAEPAGFRSLVIPACCSAWNIDPLLGVIGVQN